MMFDVSVKNPPKIVALKYKILLNLQFNVKFDTGLLRQLLFIRQN